MKSTKLEFSGTYYKRERYSEECKLCETVHNMYYCLKCEKKLKCYGLLPDRLICNDFRPPHICLECATTDPQFECYCIFKKFEAKHYVRSFECENFENYYIVDYGNQITEEDKKHSRLNNTFDLEEFRRIHLFFEKLSELNELRRLTSGEELIRLYDLIDLRRQTEQEELELVTDTEELLRLIELQKLIRINNRDVINK